jgi:hypothetical protein
MNARTHLCSLVAVFSAASLLAQQPIAFEEAQKAARKLAESAPVSDAPFAVTPDTSKPQGIKADRRGLIVLPDQKLSAELLAAANAAITPVGQLWTLRLNVASNGQPTAADRLRLIKITDNETTREVQLYYLGATKNAQGALELVVFGKEKEPLLRVPLSKGEAVRQEFPIEVSGAKNDDRSGTLTLRIFGEYTARLVLMRDGDE